MSSCNCLGPYGNCPCIQRNKSYAVPGCQINDLVYRPQSLNDKDSKPFKCPNCSGEGQKPNGREDGEIRWTECISCKGKGIVWRDE